jgi:alpha-L-rhamnosidase
MVVSEQQAQRQSAYHVLVADSEEALQRDEGNLWDSGKVASDETASIVYEGGVDFILRIF